MKVAALVDNLFFRSKIHATADQAGSEVVFCRSGDAVPADSARVIVDLEASAFHPIQEIVSVKNRTGIPVLAFAGHTRKDLLDQAREAGADEVMPRSELVNRLPVLLSPGSARPESR